MKEEAFFKHATMFCSGSHKNMKCFGKPKEVPDNFPPGSTLRCLNCKITLHGKEEFSAHLQIQNCKGPLYARLASGDISVKDVIENVGNESSEVLSKVEETKESSSVMKAISHLNEVIQTINSPASKQEAVPETSLCTSIEEKENLC